MKLTVGEYHGDGQLASNAEGDNAAPCQGAKLGLAMADLTPDCTAAAGGS